MLQTGHHLEIVARDLGEPRRELVGTDVAERGGEAVDRIVLGWQRAVATRIMHRQAERHVYLFTRLHGTHQALAVETDRVARVHVDDVRRVDQVTMIREQPLDAVVIHPSFLAGREGDDQIAVRPIAFLLEPCERGDQNGGSILDILRATAVEESILFGEREGIERPILAARFDDVEVREKQDRLG